MILHCVFCTFEAGVSVDAQSAIFDELEAFSHTLDGVEKFDHGPNRDFENKSAQFQSGFVIRFADQGSLEAYAVHPSHKMLGGKLCDMCVGGADGIIVFDIETI